MVAQISNNLPSIFEFLMVAFMVLAVLIIMAITLVVYCKICTKAGYNWAWGLLMFVPIAGLILLLYFAFAEWPIQRELRQLRQRPPGTPA